MAPPLTQGPTRQLPSFPIDATRYGHSATQPLAAPNNWIEILALMTDELNSHDFALCLLCQSNFKPPKLDVLYHSHV